MKTKFCSKCKTEKPITEFGKDGYNPSGITTYCKKCKRVYVAESVYKSRNTENGFLKSRINAFYTPSSIKKRNFIPECSKKEIIESYYNYTKKYGKICFYCKEPFTFIFNRYTPNPGNKRKNKEKGDQKKIKNFSIDRLDSSKTYSIDNIIFCCVECNLSKKDISISLIKRLHEIIMERNL